jgi:prophage tail gpP-like protein
MRIQALLPALILVAPLGLTACATPAPGPEPKWEVASEEEVASNLDAAVARAAKDFVQLKKDGVLLFCKKVRQIGSNIATLRCLTEAELRLQVENMQKYRDDMRQRSGRCAHGPGCSSGGG